MERSLAEKLVQDSRANTKQKARNRKATIRSSSLVSSLRLARRLFKKRALKFNERRQKELPGFTIFGSLIGVSLRTNVVLNPKSFDKSRRTKKAALRQKLPPNTVVQPQPG